MSSPVGHGLVALALYESFRPPRRDAADAADPALARRWPWVFVAASVLPDIDSVLGAAFGERAVSFLNVAGGCDVHRGLTHTLAFVLVAGPLLFGLAALRLPHSPWRLAPGLVLALASHPALDWGMADAASGIPFLWPLSDTRYLSPWPLVPTAYYSLSLGGILGILVHPGTLRGFFLEAGIFIPWFVAAYQLRRWREGALAVPPLRLARELALLAALSAGAVAATWHIMSHVPS